MNTLLFTSVTLYLSEAVLFFMFFTGLWRAVGVFVRLWFRGRDELWSRGVFILPKVSETFLRRFAFFQIVFVAVWSILFKGVLYTTLPHAEALTMLSKGQSLGIAIPAECIILLLILWGVAHWWLRAVAKISSSVLASRAPEPAKVPQDGTFT